jgi:multisubunit Na+/H+ antiporter MnhB subunit
MQLPVLVAASVAVQVTVVTPRGKVEPDGGVQTGVNEPSQLSVAVAVKVTATEHIPAGEFIVIGAGQVTTGASSSLTVTVNEQLPELVAESVAVQVTVVMPLGNVAPDGGVQTGVIEPSQLSVAVAVNITTAEHIVLSVPVTIGDGQVTIGG